MKTVSCLHTLYEFSKPIPTTNGKPLRYLCTKCGRNFKIATGIILKGDKS
jgi:transposase-like protein